MLWEEVLEHRCKRTSRSATEALLHSARVQAHSWLSLFSAPHPESLRVRSTLTSAQLFGYAGPLSNQVAQLTFRGSWGVVSILIVCASSFLVPRLDDSIAVKISFWHLRKAFHKWELSLWDSMSLCLCLGISWCCLACLDTLLIPCLISERNKVPNKHHVHAHPRFELKVAPTHVFA